MSSGFSPPANAQKSGRLLERLRTDSRYRRQLHPRAEPPVLVAKLDDLLRRALVNPRHIAQQRPRRRIQVDSHPVHAALDRCFQRLLQLPLIHVMLILPHANRLRIDLHQFRQRILQPPRDRDGAANRQIQIRKLLPRHIRSRIHRRPRLVHGHAEHVRQPFVLQELPHQRIGLPRSRTVPDRDRPHMCTSQSGPSELRADPTRSFFGACG